MSLVSVESWIPWAINWQIKIRIGIVLLEVLSVKDSIASKQLNSYKENIGTYKPPSQNDSLFLENLSNNLSSYYENI